MKRVTFFLIAILVFVADQVTKEIILASLQPGDVIPVIPGFFNIVLAFNKGVAFGVFSDIDHDGTRHLVLGATTLVALTAVWFFARSEQCRDRVSQIALAMVLGGALGNILDRVRFGQVTDFLDVYYGTYHWPAFNIADSAITTAVVLLLFFSGKAPIDESIPGKQVDASPHVPREASVKSSQ